MIDVTKNFKIDSTPTGKLWIYINDKKILVNETDKFSDIVTIYQGVRTLPEDLRAGWLREQYEKNTLSSLTDELKEVFSGITSEEEKAYLRQKVYDGLARLISFMKDFNFDPSYRFVNTLSHKLTVSKEEAKEYIKSYFELIDSAYLSDVIAKIKSKEFDEILEDISRITPNKHVNQRLEIYYGSQGTGKTTLAMEQAEGRCIICNNNMNCDDLMKNFDFKDNGNATFRHSLLRQCMEEGKTVTFDEINLLPYESQRFLQGLLDGKQEFNYGEDVIHIKEGFKVIGTMNLTVNGMTYSLPEPLVDRCANAKKFALTADALMGAIC